jgi:hypothetical protein
VALSPEQAAQTYTLRRLTLGRGTGGYDEDRQLGDEALQVVLEPRDTEDHIIKAPGTVSVIALEISREGIKTPFSSWVVPPEQLRKSWRNGFFSTGYILVLPWQAAPPHSEQVRVVARLQTSDGRVFEAERDVRVVLRPEVLREKMPPAQGTPPAGPPTTEPPPAATPPVPTPPAPVPPPPTLLPMPRKVEPVPPAEGPALPSPTAATIEPVANWQAAPLDGAVLLRPPLPLQPGP